MRQLLLEWKSEISQRAPRGCPASNLFIGGIRERISGDQGTGGVIHARYVNFVRKVRYLFAFLAISSCAAFTTLSYADCKTSIKRDEVTALLGKRDTEWKVFRAYFDNRKDITQEFASVYYRLSAWFSLAEAELTDLNQTVFLHEHITGDQNRRLVLFVLRNSLKSIGDNASVYSAAFEAEKTGADPLLVRILEGNIVFFRDLENFGKSCLPEYSAVPEPE